VIVDEHLAERADTLGTELMRRLQGIRNPFVRDVRGLGLLIGIELSVKAKKLASALLAEGVLAKDTQDYVLRIAPPLILEREHVDMIVTAVERGLNAMTSL